MRLAIHCAAAICSLLALTAHGALQAVTICPIVQVGRTGHAQHAAFATAYWAAEAPNLNISVQFVGTYEAAGSSVRGVVGAFVNQGANCDAVIGPGISDVAVGMNPVVNQMWVEFASSTTDFSSRFNYPYFNRVNPDVSVTQLMMAKMLVRFGWNKLSIFCSATSYGNSVSGIIQANLGSGGRAYVNDCVANNLGYNATRERLVAMTQTPSRVIVFALSNSDPVTKTAQQVVRDMNLTQTAILIWADSICVSGSTAWAFPGSYCAAYDVDATRYGDFFAAYSGRSAKLYGPAIQALGYPASQVDFNSSKGNQQAYAADAARVAVRALSAYYQAQTLATYRNPLSAAGEIRAVDVSDALSGRVVLPTGDRQFAPIKLYNAQGASGKVVEVAAQAADGTLTVSETQYALGEYRTPSTMPYAVAPDPPPPPALWIIAVVIGGLIVVGVPVGRYTQRRYQLSARPLDASKPLAVVFVGVKNAPELRDLGPECSERCFTELREFVRGAVRETRCFEARRIDDATVMIVAKQTGSALQCASMILERCESFDWSQHISAIHAMMPTIKRDVSTRDSDGDDRRSRTSPSRSDSSASKSQSSMSRHKSGRHSSTHAAPRRATRLEVHIGVHFGFATIDHDPDTDAVSYMGDAVARAAVVADAAADRQILVSGTAYEAVMEGAGDAEPESLGTFMAAAADADDAASASDAAYVFVPSCMPSTYTESLQRRKSAKMDVAAGNAGGIMSALANADTGVSKRRVGIASIEIPELAKHRSAAAITELSADLQVIREIIASHRGELLSIQDSTVLVGVNCSGTAVASAAARAAAIAVKIATEFDSDDAVEHPSAGVAFGTAIASSNVCIGDVAHLAGLMRRAAKANDVRCCAAAGGGPQDLDSVLQLLTVDYVGVAPGRSSVRVYAVLGELESSDEWLYAMNKAEWCRVNEGAWNKLCVVDDDAVANAQEMRECATSVSDELEKLLHDNNASRPAPTETPAALASSARRLGDIAELAMKGYSKERSAQHRTNNITAVFGPLS